MEYYKSYLWLLVAVAMLALGVAGDEQAIRPEEEHEQHIQSNVIPQSTAHPVDNNLPSALANILTNGGFLAGAVLAVGLLAILVAPIFGLKFCTLFGNCGQDTTAYQGYSASPNVYADYQGYQQGTYNNPVYQKRSLEYVGPILKALSNAYDRYSRSVAVQSKTN